MLSNNSQLFLLFLLFDFLSLILTLTLSPIPHHMFFSLTPPPAAYFYPASYFHHLILRITSLYNYHFPTDHFSFPHTKHSNIPLFHNYSLLFLLLLCCCVWIAYVSTSSMTYDFSERFQRTTFNLQAMYQCSAIYFVEMEMRRKFVREEKFSCETDADGAWMYLYIKERIAHFDVYCSAIYRYHNNDDIAHSTVISVHAKLFPTIHFFF